MKYYRQDKPKLNDIVYCKIIDIKETCALVELIEYNNIQGIIIIADITIRKKRKSFCLIKKNKKYPLIIKNINSDGKFELSYKYVSTEMKNSYMDFLVKYQKSLKIYTYFLKSINKNYTDDMFHCYGSKTIWKLDKKNLFEYITSFYLKKNNLELFDINESEKENFMNALIKFFGKLEIETKFTFSIKNPNYNGVNEIINILDTLKQKYNVDTFIENIPKYYFKIKSDNIDFNNNLVEQINKFLADCCSEKKCIYFKHDIFTNSNISIR